MKKQKATSGIFKAFIVSAMGTGLSRIFGALRDVAIAHFFGAGKLTDAFWVAFTIPSVFRRFVADEGFTGAMIPVIAQEEENQGRESARLMTDAIFTVLIIFLFMLSCIGVLFAPFLVTIFAWGFRDSPDQFHIAVVMTRWLFPFVALVSLVSYCEGILNHRNHFFIPKIAPGIVSLCIIISIVNFRQYFSTPIYVLLLGVLIGGVLHLLINIPVLNQLWFIPRLRFNWTSKRLRSFFHEMGKVALIGIFAQLNIIILRTLASLLAPGSVTYYWNANRMVDLTQGMIAVGLGSALMPRAAKSVVAKDWRSVEEQLLYAFRLAAFFLVPVCVLLLVFSFPLVSILFRHGEFTLEDTRYTSQTLVFLAPFLINVAGINIVKKIYFALNDRNILLLIGALGTVLTGILGWYFIGPWGVQGLAAALSISTFLQFLSYLYILPRRSEYRFRYNSLKIPIIRIVAASLVFGCVLIGFRYAFNWESGLSFNTFFICFFALLISGTSYFAMTHLLGLKDTKSMVSRIKNRMYKSKNMDNQQ